MAHQQEQSLSMYESELEGITNSEFSDDEKVRQLITKTAVICGAVAVQPIPFADMPILTSIQLVMGWKIAKIRKVDITKEGVSAVLKHVAGVVGMGFFAQQGVIGVYKIGLPFLGGLMTVPLVFGLTFGMGRAMDLYFKAKRDGQSLDAASLRNAYKRGKAEGKSASR